MFLLMCSCPSGLCRYYYKCARDGEKKSHKKSAPTTTSERSRTTRKCSISCPAHIVATDNSDQIEVTYFALHVGRGTDKTTELKHQRLPKSAQNEITAKLQLGVSADRILTGTAASPSLYVFQ